MWLKKLIEPFDPAVDRKVPVTSELQQDPIAAVKIRIATLLAGNLGAYPHIPTEPGSPTRIGLSWGAGFAVVFAGLPWIVFRDTGPLFWLSIWGSCYFACAAALAVSTSSAISRVIGKDILPELSDAAAIAIRADLNKRFNEKRISIVSIFVASVAAATTAYMLRLDLSSSSGLEICWLCAGYFILYVTAARTT
jgi:hypothetical protein